MPIIVGAYAPTFAEVEAVLVEILRKTVPRDDPAAVAAFIEEAKRPYDNGRVCVWMIPIHEHEASQVQAKVEHHAKDHAKVSVYISGLSGSVNTFVIVATRSMADMDKIRQLVPELID